MNMNRVLTVLCITLMCNANLLGQIFSDQFFLISDNVGSEDFAVEEADFDGNGEKDLLLNSNLGLRFFLQQSSNQFSEIEFNPFGIDSVTSFEVGDIDNDGSPDIVLASDKGQLSIALNDGLGNFPNLTNLETPIFNPEFTEIIYSDIELADLNNDGSIDIVVTTFPMTTFQRYMNLGNGIIDSPKLMETSFYSGSALDRLSAVDIDSDGDIDIAYVVDKSPQFIINDGSDNFSNSYLLLNYPAEEVAEVFYEDIDSDGDLDSHVESWYVWQENIDGNYFGQGNIINNPGFFNNFVEHTIISDFDFDGDLDFIMGAFGIVSSFAIMINDGTGTFEFSLLEGREHNIIELKDFDLDNSGSDDIVAFDFDEASGKTRLLWYPNITQFDSVSGCAFHDANLNGVKDGDERPIGNILIKIDSENTVFPAGEDGCYSFFIDDGDYEIGFVPSSLWQLTTDSSSYSVSVDGSSIQNLDFGFFPTDTLIRGVMHAASGIVRCNRDVRFDFTFQNQGATIVTEGILWVTQDSLTVLANGLNPIDTMLADGTFGWKFSNLYPGESITKSVNLSIPGLGDDVEPGTLINIFSAAEVFNALGFQNFVKHELSQEIRCSYDPNDKLISPKRSEEENYTLFGDTLIYTVRFQNTGNDTAFNVVIRDTLDTNLDVSTFNIVHSSHRSNLQTSIHNGNEVTFDFENILLPDSTEDFMGSQGYVTYSILTNENLDEYTLIENTGHIYFDFNPPIVTNTTLSTLVTCYPVEEQFIEVTIANGEEYELPNGIMVSQAGNYMVTIEDNEGCPLKIYSINLSVLTNTEQLYLENAIHISPNPSKDKFILTLDVNEDIDFDGLIYDLVGKLISSAEINFQQTKFDTQNLKNGIYLLKIQDSQGALLGLEKFVVTK